MNYFMKNRIATSRLEVNNFFTTTEQENAPIKEKKELIGEWFEPIPVLVFVCNRSTAITNHVQKLLKYLLHYNYVADKFILSWYSDLTNVRKTFAKSISFALAQFIVSIKILNK